MSVPEGPDGAEREALRQWRHSMVRLMLAMAFCGGFLAGVMTSALRVPAVFFPLVVMGCLGLGWLVSRRGR